MLTCENCEKYLRIGTPERGVCSLQESYFPAEDKKPCRYLTSKSKHCGDCTYFQTDPACGGCEPTDSICLDFKSKDQVAIERIAYDIMLSGDDPHKVIDAWIDEAIPAEVRAFIQKESLRVQGMPFNISRENPETIAALDEYNEMKKKPENYKRYSSFKDAMNEALSDS